MGDIQQDPSMEDILASIKRVIADDGRTAPLARDRRSVIPEPEPADDDVLELDDPVSEATGLMSRDKAEASREKLAALSALHQQNEVETDTAPLEAVVREMLKPILKQWLDDHLPEIVEELVTREIVRITGRSL